MPAAVSETGVRAPAHAPITSGRPHAGADQASSPFSELLNNCEASGDETPDLAAPKPAAADVSTPETPVVVAKTTTPEIDPQVPKAKDAGQAEAELALAIVAAVPQPSGEKPAQPVALAETTDASAPQETKPDRYVRRRRCGCRSAAGSDRCRCRTRSSSRRNACSD